MFVNELMEFSLYPFQDIEEQARKEVDEAIANKGKMVSIFLNNRSYMHAKL